MSSVTVEEEIDRATAAELVPCTLTELLFYFLRLGTTGFGGPIALVGYMQRDLVEKRRWISRQDYVEGLALDRKSTRLNSSHLVISYAVFCLKKKKIT